MTIVRTNPSGWSNVFPATSPLLASGTMTDKSGNGHDSTVLSTSNLEDADFTANASAGGISTYALGPLAGNEHINIPHHADLDFEINEPWSWSCWLRLDPGSTKIAYEKRSQIGPFEGMWMGINGSGTFRCLLQSSTSGKSIDVQGTVDNGDEFNYVHCVWTYSGSETAGGLRLYVNGVTEAMTTLDDDFNAGSMLNSNPSYISSPSPTTTWAGPGASQDEMCIWNRMLTPSEVTATYGAGSPPNLKLLSSTAAIVAYWGLGEDESTSSPTTYDQLFPYELNLLDTNIARAVDGAAGGHYVPSSKLRVGGSGIQLAGQLKLKGRESTHFLDITNGQPDTNVGRVYTWEDNAWVQQEASLSLHTLVFDLDLPDGCTLKTLTTYLIGAAGHGSSPAVDELLPRISLMHPGPTGALALAITSIDTTTTAAEYEVAHSITLTANTVIDRQTKQARLLFIGENNNFVTGLRLTALSATITQPYKSEW